MVSTAGGIEMKVGYRARLQRVKGSNLVQDALFKWFIVQVQIAENKHVWSSICENDYDLIHASAILHILGRCRLELST